MLKAATPGLMDIVCNSTTNYYHPHKQIHHSTSLHSVTPVCWNVQNIYTSPLDHSDNNSTSLGTIQLSYNYCAKTSLHPPSPVTHLYPACQPRYCGESEITQASKRIQTRALSIVSTMLKIGTQHKSSTQHHPKSIP